jgi:hypothetical protein
MIAALATAASIHRSGVPSGAGSTVRTAIKQAIPPEPELSGSPRRGGDAGGRQAGDRGLRVTLEEHHAGHHRGHGADSAANDEKEHSRYGEPNAGK